MKTPIVVIAFLAISLAGCSEDAAVSPEEPALDVTDTTGCIRGVVVDDAIRPLADATVTIQGRDETAVTDQDGAFLFCDLPAGTYFLLTSRPLYESVQTSWTVEAGVERPAIAKIQLARIPGAEAYLQTSQFDGFYSCAFALVFITDSCDFAIRTAHDAGATPVPRDLGGNHNTQYLAFSPFIITVIQETWWNEDATRTFRSSLQDTPIDNLCDCSTKHMERKGDGGYIHDRMDKDNPVEKNTGGTQSWPAMDDLENGEVVVRGFIPFQDGLSDYDYALNLDFQIFTTFFYHYTPPETWSMETQDQYPVPR